MTLDAQGRMIDENGKVIELGKLQSDLKINQKGNTAPKVIDGVFNANSQDQNKDAE